MKLGISGSSHGIAIRERLASDEITKPLDYWLSEFDVVNCAASAKGTKLYLNKILYMQKMHKVDLFLMEGISNMSLWNATCVTESYTMIYELEDIDDFLLPALRELKH